MPATLPADGTVRLEGKINALRTVLHAPDGADAEHQESDEKHPQPLVKGRPPAHGSPKRTITVDDEWQRFVVSTSTNTGHPVYSRGTLR